MIHIILNFRHVKPDFIDIFDSAIFQIHIKCCPHFTGKAELLEAEYYIDDSCLFSFLSLFFFLKVVRGLLLYWKTKIPGHQLSTALLIVLNIKKKKKKSKDLLRWIWCFCLNLFLQRSDISLVFIYFMSMIIWLHFNTLWTSFSLSINEIWKKSKNKYM